MTYYDSVTDTEVVNATGYYVNLCIQNQDDIRSVVSSIPQFLSSANGVLQTYNSANACQYLANGIGREDDCVSVLGGLMTSGLGNAMEYVINYAQ